MSAVEIRQHMIDALKADLVGPYQLDEADTATETLPLPPSRWYLTGCLANQADRLNDDPDAEDEGGAGDDVDDGTSAAAQSEIETKQPKLFPASMGMSVLIPPGQADTLELTLRFAEYHRIEQPDDSAEEEETDEGKRRRRKVIWKRVPYVSQLTIPLNKAALEAGVSVPEHYGLTFSGRLEPITGISTLDGVKALSLFLTNNRATREYRDEAWLFQVSFEIKLPSEGRFVPRPDPRAAGSSDWDERVADLQFRGVRSYGVGHGVSIEEDEDGAWIRTCWVPEGQVKRVRTRSVDQVNTRMEDLATLSDGAALKAALSPLCDAYMAWIQTQRGVDVGGDSRATTRNDLMHDAEQACDRIRAGIEHLAHDTTAREAFCLMNQAMALAARQRSPQRYASGQAPSWRLFQLAFVLLNISGVAVDGHPDRDTVELIFFPTGGGKTEAYLGVIGFTLLLRRMHGIDRPDLGLGVAVILRYTLRLLTLDQLGRAATLICALEVLRRKRPNHLGTVRFSIGLWVGRSATANTMSQVKQSINAYKGGKGGSPFPLTTCPWCNSELKGTSLRLMPSSAKPEQVQVNCPEERCEFNQAGGSLPILFVDEQIYRELPCFILATVDKFAMLPWRGETAALFGKVHSRSGVQFFGPVDSAEPRSKHIGLPGGLRPPELIVQDEVHLISGPLGTMVGLYETAIERLCVRYTASGGKRRPKILASTATVRKANDQMLALFGRPETRVFPPPGIDDGESFFAEMDLDAPDRRYVGVAAAGRSFKAVQLRAYVTLLAAAQHQYNAHKGDADAWMSLVGYFNSLRELGGMRRMAEDEIRSRVGQAAGRRPLDHADRAHRWLASRKLDTEPIELTSRESTARIAQSKSRLGLSHAQKGSVDVALATNMISVGLDIDRLGMMVVAGQPKTTAEYIQASSRVGRDISRPGLVITCLNQYRPRDRSHYEHFNAFHRSFYRYVEANSLTPFSAPALDRGLAGMLVALIRLSISEMTPPQGVEAIDAHRALADTLAQGITERAKAVSALSHDEEEALVATLTGRTQALLDSWTQIIDTARNEEASKRRYSQFDRGSQGKALLRLVLDTDALEMASDDERRFTAPTSMRDVEPSVHVWLNLKPKG